MATLIKILALGTTVLTLNSAIHAAVSPQFSSELQRFLQQNPQIFSHSKTIAEAKISADLNQVLTQGITKSIPSILVSKNGTIAVQIQAISGQGLSLERQLRSQGIEVQARIKDQLFVNVAQAKIKQVIQSSQVKSADLQGILENNQDMAVSELLNRLGLADQQQGSSISPPHTSYSSPNTTNSTQSEGNTAIATTALHQKGFTGKGLKIGILDFGYRHYTKLQTQGIVPAPSKTKTFDNDQNANEINVQASSEHGTACAEIIHQIAPDAELYLVQAGNGDGRASSGQVAAAIDWLIEQDVDIINFSGGGHHSQHDGTSALDQKVSEALNKNILWVNAAGNEGEKIWTGQLLDRNLNGLVDIGQYDVLTFEKKGDSNTMIMLNWDDWDSSRQNSQNIDVDAVILAQDSNGEVVKVAEINQPRTTNTAARKSQTLRLPVGKYGIALRSSQSAPKNIRVYVENAHLDLDRPYSSIAIPATSADALAVAAWDVKTQQIAAYSSRGATDDGRVKPDVSAPTNTLNAAYQASGRSRFTGTSAAAPYTAAFAALVWQAQPNLNAKQLKQLIIQKATNAIGQAPNNNAGYGLINANTFLSNVHLTTPSHNTPTPQPTLIETPTPQPAPTETPVSNRSSSEHSDQDVQNLMNRLGL